LVDEQAQILESAKTFTAFSDDEGAVNSQVNVVVVAFGVNLVGALDLVVVDHIIIVVLIVVVDLIATKFLVVVVAAAVVDFALLVKWPYVVHL